MGGALKNNQDALKKIVGDNPSTQMGEAIATLGKEIEALCVQRAQLEADVGNTNPAENIEKTKAGMEDAYKLLETKIEDRKG